MNALFAIWGLAFPDGQFLYEITEMHGIILRVTNKSFGVFRVYSRTV